ncbi:MAG TPA: DUF4153 domain-containing protein [Peptococcaceae bacterium]|nr:DUF4153 domain-containing protein [Peptococcaceae bacterium]
MKITPAVKHMMTVLSVSLKRFPLTILFSTAVAIMLIMITELRPLTDTNLTETLYRITMILALGIPLSLCLKLFWERKGNGKPSALIGLYSAGFVMLLLYYFFLLNTLDMVSITRYIGVSLALYLAFLFIPYLPRREQFEMYVIRLGTGFCITVIYAAVLYLGLAAILFTIDQLLGIQIAGKAYFYVWLFVACLFAPAYFLADIPLQDEQLEQKNYLKLLRVLLLYIVMPLLTAYTAILYIYFVKIIVVSEWPVGLVSHLVLWYGVIVTIVLFLISPIKDESKWANGFLVWMPRVILPILVMMFISMGIRINAYGVTENRYYVIILGLWVFGIMLYYILTKKRNNIIIPVTLAVIALIAVFGPLSSYSISTLSQNNRLEATLLRNDMLQEGKIQAAAGDIPEKDKTEISRILDYFNDNHNLADVKYFPDNFGIDDIDKVFGFSYVPYTHPAEHSAERFYYFTTEEPERAIDIQGYDYMFGSMFLYAENSTDSTGDTIAVDYDDQSSIVKVYGQGILLYEKALNSFVGELFDKHQPSTEGESIPAEEMTLIEENEQVKVKFIFMHIMGNEDVTTGDLKLERAEFYLLVKIK